MDLGFARNSFAINLNYIHADKQDEIASFELPTDSYSLLNLDINKIFNTANTETIVFLKAQNLLDEDIRDHGFVH